MTKDEISYGYATHISGLEEENRFLKESIENLERELEKFKKTPLIACEVKNLIQDKALIKLPNGNEFLVEISEKCEKLTIGDTVLADQKNLTIIKKIPQTRKYDADRFVIIEKPKIKWENVGGLKKQEREIKEVIELPLKKPKLFEKIGIEPPKGILLYGPPGTGKTLLAKAVASSTNSTFIEVVGSELVQKFIGEGAKLVKEIFQIAKEKAPSIIFIDEIDAIASVRMDIGTSGEREVQRTFMQLLAEIDGFKPLGNIKIIGCTNRKDILDPAITRPGRLDRLIYVPLPEKEAREEIFKIHTKNMKLKKINMNKIVKMMKGFSGAEIKAAVTEAGYYAIRENRKTITEKDFTKAIQKVKKETETEREDYIKMFG
ncbi:proteasome-activating nucleotidase [Candidatus Woesearchaeota archaeon]|nr:MAG: proteasome-activating nucleotidase [Candidatus Woesearchaeota archaeon]